MSLKSLTMSHAFGLLFSSVIFTFAESTASDVVVGPLDIIASCEEPKEPVHAFYVDPKKGSAKGDGSRKHPWHTLKEVVDAKLINGADPSKGVVHAGDIIYLMSGNHGSVKFPNNSNNTDFITIQAAPDQAPVLNGLLMYGGDKWVFKGLVIQNAEDGKATQLARMTPVNHLIFTGNTIYSQPDVSKWSPEDWLKSGSTGIMYDGECATIADNVVKNVRRGITIGGDKILLTHNVVDYYADDGIDFTSGNTIISFNRVINHYGRLDDGNHNDGIQGWAVGEKAMSNLTIDSNVVLESTGDYPEISLLPTGIGPDGIQGICVFDGTWSQVRVTNNVVGVSLWHGISMYGLSDSNISNNTLIKQSNNSKIGPWIGVFAGKNKGNSENVVVRNNIANNFNLSPASVVQDHNISFQKKPGNWGGLGQLTIVDPASVFVKYDSVKGLFDLNLCKGSPAIGTGTSHGCPAEDILGRERKKNAPDIGAYAYGDSPEGKKPNTSLNKPKSMDKPNTSLDKPKSVKKPKK